MNHEPVSSPARKGTAGEGSGRGVARVCGEKGHMDTALRIAATKRKGIGRRGQGVAARPSLRVFSPSPWATPARKGEGAGLGGRGRAVRNSRERGGGHGTAPPVLKKRFFLNMRMHLEGRGVEELIRRGLPPLGGSRHTGPRCWDCWLTSAVNCRLLLLPPLPLLPPPLLGLLLPPPVGGPRGRSGGPGWRQARLRLATAARWG